jgi:hypothetical protein
MLKADIEVVVEDGGLPDSAGVAEAASLDGEGEAEKVGRLCCAGIFDVEPWVAGCGAGIGVLTWEQRSELGRCSNGICEGGREKRHERQARGKDGLKRHLHEEKQIRRARPMLGVNSSFTRRIGKKEWRCRTGEREQHLYIESMIFSRSLRRGVHIRWRGAV